MLVALSLGGALVAQPPGDLELNSIGVSVSTAIAMRHAGDGSGRLFIVERDGTILIWEEGTGLVGSPFLNITSSVDDFNFEGGMLGLAFHPDYSTNGYFYVYYTRGGPNQTVISRFTVSAGDANDADEGSEVEIFSLNQPAGNHNGGDIHFGPDGYLYIALGDGGASSATSQNTTNFLGKMLRIDPCATPTCAQPYTIPADNPFVGDGSTFDEIWGIGFRNPYRWSFDSSTGDILIADVGAGTREEVSLEPAGSSGGLNYGWNCREGDVVGTGCAGTFVDPVLVYPHSSGNCSITGGYRYRGCISGLVGTYIFSDFCTARVWFGTEDTPGNWSFSEWDDLSGSVYGYGEDENGEVYLSQGGSIFRFESATGCDVGLIYRDGFETGDTTMWSGTVSEVPAQGPALTAEM